MLLLENFDFQDIFSPDTLTKVDEKSLQTMQRLLKGENPQKILSSIRSIVYKLKEIEDGYEDYLEMTAVDIVEQLFPILEENNIEIEAKIGRPNFSAMSEPEEDDDEDEDDLDIFSGIEPPESSIKKRRVLNAITQGGSINNAFSFYLYKEALDDLDPELVEKYLDFANKAFGVYASKDVVAMIMNMIKSMMGRQPAGQDGEAEGGVNRVQRTEDGYKIVAFGDCFVLLLHEILKGVFEVFSLQGTTGIDSLDDAIFQKADMPFNEPEDMRTGQVIYQALLDTYNQYSSGDDNRVRSYFYIDVYKLEDDDFLSYVENSINDSLTPKQVRWTMDTISQIEDDLAQDDENFS